MANVQHSALTGSELHEPKGAATANNGEVYIANGAGSGTWTELFQYGNIYTQESDASTLSTIGTTVKDLTFSTDGEANICVADSANNRITLTNAGKYHISFTGSVSTVAAGDAGTYKFKVALNSIPTVLEAEIEMSGTSDLSEIAVTGILDVTAGQQLTVEVESDEAGNTDDLNLVNLQLTALRLGA